MKITLTTQEGIVTKILKKMTFVFFGVFMTSLIFSMLISSLGKYGILLGLLICGGLIFAAFYYVEKGSRLRLIAWSMIGTIAVVTILFIVGISFISGSIGSLQK